MATEQTQAAAPAEAKPKEEKQTNCLGCNKPIKKIRRYYRDGKYYCTKKCWISYIKKSKSEEKQ
jgi:hypothetical protein